MKARYANTTSDHTKHVAEPVTITLTDHEAQILREHLMTVTGKTSSLTNLYGELVTLRNNLGAYGAENL